MRIADLRRLAIARSLFPPTTLARAIRRLGFVQADPIRAPARAQDLTLRQRVIDYRVGDLERQYHALGIEEAFFVNYGFVTRELHQLLHPRHAMAAQRASRSPRMQALLAFVRDKGTVHPREVDRHFAHGRVTNYWGGSSNATTHMLDLLHHRGLLRVARREGGIRIYAARVSTADATRRRTASTIRERQARIDALVDAAVAIYAPLPALSLSNLLHRIRYGGPDRSADARGAVKRARQRLAHVHVDGIDWYWSDEERAEPVPPDSVRLLAPFDPVVWDRRRFELFWGWAYRFEAYTPLPKRKLGYYALPLLWREQVIGWGNISVRNGLVEPDFGYIGGARPRDRLFTRELDAEVARIEAFLRLTP